MFLSYHLQPSATYILFVHSKQLAIEAADLHKLHEHARRLQEHCADF
jgi:hypothetical protein